MNAWVFLAFTALLSAPLAWATEPKRDALIVYGSGFAFSVTEPSGWVGDTEHAAALAANVSFVRKGESVRGAKALIRIRVNGKVDENTAEDLKADMNGYRAERPNVQFEDVALDHPLYASFPKLFFQEGSFFEYVTYLNPGRDVPLLLSVSMNVSKVRATEEDLAALREVVRSIVVLPGVKVREGAKGPPN